MAIKFEKIQPGMTLWDAHTYLMGNTTLRSWGVWSVEVVEVDAEKRLALVRWNGNPATWWHASKLRKLRAKKPKLVPDFGCGWRLARGDEKKVE